MCRRNALFCFKHFAAIYERSEKPEKKTQKSHQLAVVKLKSHVCLINYHLQTISRAHENTFNIVFLSSRPTEILQSSRCSRMEQSLIDAEDSGIYQNLNETSRVRDVNDILGPLPQIPSGFVDCDKNWSRRVSGFSEIYEEIIDPSTRFVTKTIRQRNIAHNLTLNF